MKWFDNWFARQCEKAWNSKKDVDEQEKVSYIRTKAMHNKSASVSVNDTDVIEDLTCYIFKLQPAEGGTIVQVMHFVNNKSQTSGDWVKDLYIIPDTKDFGEELTSVLVQYKLKHQ
jgi:hypothetical protein